MEITSLEDAVVAGVRNPAYLFCGPPGKGKTFFAYLMHRELLFRDPTTRSLWLDVDRKLDSDVSIDPRGIDIWQPSAAVSNRGEIGIIRTERKDPSGKPIAGTEGYVPKDPKVYAELVAQINKLLSSDKFPYKLVVLDTLSTAVEHLESLILYHHQVSAMSINLWGVYGANVRELLNGFLSLPCTKVVIAHTVTREDELTKEITVTPSVSGQQGEKLAKNFNEVYYFEGFDPISKKWKVMVRAPRKYQARTTHLFPTPVVDTETLLKAIV